MQKDKCDKRSNKTRQKLEQSLFKLLKTKDISRITVKEITSISDINRSTFYDHYDDIYDLLENVQDRILSDLSLIYKDVKLSSFREDEFNQIYILLEYIKDNKEAFNVLLNGYGNILFAQKLRKIITDKFLRDLIGNTEDSNHDFTLLSSFFVSGCLGLIQNWIKDDSDLSAKELSEIMRKLILSSVETIKIS